MGQEPDCGLSLPPSPLRPQSLACSTGPHISHATSPNLSDLFSKMESTMPFILLLGVSDQGTVTVLPSGPEFWDTETEEAEPVD